LNNNTKEDSFDYFSKNDPSNNTCYEEKGLLKISNDIIVPDYLVSLIIGRNGDCIKSLSNKTGCAINFLKEVFIVFIT